MDKFEIGKIKEELKAIPLWPWYVDEGFSVVRNVSTEDSHSMPYWAESVDKSKKNPFKPYKLSYAALSFVAKSPQRISDLIKYVKELETIIKNK